MDRGAWWAVVHGVAKHRTQPSVHTQYSIVYMSHVFFTHPSVGGHLSLGCCCVFSVVNSAAVNIGVRVFSNSFSLDKCPGGSLLGHMVALF